MSPPAVSPGLAEIRALARKRPETEFLLNRLYGAHVSPFFTLACLRLGLRPDHVTVVGAAFGGLGVTLLFLPLGPWSIVAVVALQVGYILDFSDGQVARLTGRTSMAGAYLDWLTHFYVPVGAAMATAASLAWATGSYWVLAAGLVGALELAAFAFSCKEHVLVSMLRDNPGIGATGPFQAALADDARPRDVSAADNLPRSRQAGGIAGRRHRPSLRSILGELLIYPGAVHLLTIATIVDVVVQAVGMALPPARGALLVAWAALLVVHAPMLIRRNHAVIRAVEARIEGAARQDQPSQGPSRRDRTRQDLASSDLEA
jgi:phosphatidylglycerophosphate synthase